MVIEQAKYFMWIDDDYFKRLDNNIDRFSHLISQDVTEEVEIKIQMITMELLDHKRKLMSILNMRE